MNPSFEHSGDPPASPNPAITGQLPYAWSDLTDPGGSAGSAVQVNYQINRIRKEGVRGLRVAVTKGFAKVGQKVALLGGREYTMQVWVNVPIPGLGAVMAAAAGGGGGGADGAAGAAGGEAAGAVGGEENAAGAGAVGGGTLAAGAGGDAAAASAAGEDIAAASAAGDDVAAASAAGDDVAAASAAGDDVAAASAAGGDVAARAASGVGLQAETVSGEELAAGGQGEPVTAAAGGGGVDHSDSAEQVWAAADDAMQVTLTLALAVEPFTVVATNTSSFSAGTTFNPLQIPRFQLPEGPLRDYMVTIQVDNQKVVSLDDVGVEFFAPPSGKGEGGLGRGRVNGEGRGY